LVPSHDESKKKHSAEQYVRIGHQRVLTAQQPEFDQDNEEYDTQAAQDY
jgi:hypothetical protein